MENFAVGEIIWAKIRGHPWWPGLVKLNPKYQITGVDDDSKEKKYLINFIGDNSHATLPKPKLAKFMSNYKTYSQTKKKNLLDSIKKAKEMFDNKSLIHDDIKNEKNNNNINNSNNNISKMNSSSNNILKKPKQKGKINK